MRKTVFINLSGVAAPEVGDDFIPTTLKNIPFTKEIVRLWPSIKAFAKLRGRYDEQRLYHQES